MAASPATHAYGVPPGSSAARTAATGSVPVSQVTRTSVHGVASSRAFCGVGTWTNTRAHASAGSCSTIEAMAGRAVASPTSSCQSASPGAYGRAWVPSTSALAAMIPSRSPSRATEAHAVADPGCRRDSGHRRPLAVGFAYKIDLRLA